MEDSLCGPTGLHAPEPVVAEHKRACAAVATLPRQEEAGIVTEREMKHDFVTPNIVQVWLL